MASQSKGVLRKVAVDITVDTNIFASGDALHSGAILLQNCFQGDNHSGTLETIVVIDQDNEKSALSLHFFRGDPSGVAPVVNAAFDPSDADLDNLYIGYAPVAAGDYKSFADNAVATVRNVGLSIVQDTKGDRDLYLVAVSEGTPTYTAATDLRVILTFRQD